MQKETMTFKNLLKGIAQIVGVAVIGIVSFYALWLLVFLFDK